MRFAASDEKFFVLRSGFRFGPALLSSNVIEADLQTLDQRGCLPDRSPKSLTDFRSRFVDHFERPGENLVGANYLNAQALDCIGENAIDLLRLAACKPRD